MFVSVGTKESEETRLSDEGGGSENGTSLPILGVDELSEREGE
jgi:hypothetical protein